MTNNEVTNNNSSINLLLVDDSPTDRTIFRRHLSRNKDFEFNFDEVETIRAALEYLEKQVPDCILLDFALPDSTGVDLINEINERYGVNKIPIVMLSDSTNIENAVSALHLGSQDFLVKSKSSATDILRAVLNAIDKVNLHREKQEAAEKIRQSEERYRLLFDNTPLPAFVFNRETLQILAANKHAEDHFGYSREEFLQMTFDDFDAFLGASDKIVATDYCETAEVNPTVSSKQKKRNGRIIDVEINCHDIPFKGSEARFVIIRDITRQKESDDKIRKSENFNRTLIESSPDCVKLLDRDGNIIFMNDTGVKLLEIDDFESIRNRAWYEVQISAGREIIEKTLEVARTSEGKNGRFEASCLTALGNKKWWDIIVTPMRDGQGEIDTILAVSRDITESKLIEQEREKNLEREKELRAQAESANRAKDEFLAVISHELRSPLNAMSGWSKILQSGDLDESKTRQAIEVIDRNIGLQDSLIEDLLDVSRIISDKLQLEITEIDLCRQITESVETMRPLAAEKNLELSFSSNTGNCQTSADPYRIQQIVGNLLTNAIKFTPEGGKINVSLKSAGDNVKIAIKDTGIGIEKDMLPHIFDRFQQADGSTRRKFGGLGLGLSIVKSLVEMHNGQITVDSAGLRQGTEFEITLPLERSDTNAPTNGYHPLATDENGHRKLLEDLKILVVEDDADSLELINFVLSNVGAEIHGYGSAAAALQSIAEIQPDLIISDISMADTDGYDFIRKLQMADTADNKHIPAIAMTAHTSIDEKIKMMEAGFKMHIPKPIDVEHLPEQIRQFINAQ